MGIDRGKRRFFQEKRAAPVEVYHESHDEEVTIVEIAGRMLSHLLQFLIVVSVCALAAIGAVALAYPDTRNVLIELIDNRII